MIKQALKTAIKNKNWNRLAHACMSMDRMEATFGLFAIEDSEIVIAYSRFGSYSVLKHELEMSVFDERLEENCIDVLAACCFYQGDSADEQQFVKVMLLDGGWGVHRLALPLLVFAKSDYCLESANHEERETLRETEVLANARCEGDRARDN